MYAVEIRYLRIMTDEQFLIMLPILYTYQITLTQKNLNFIFFVIVVVYE